MNIDYHRVTPSQKAEISSNHLVFIIALCQLWYVLDSLKRLKMGIQSTVEEVDFDNAEMAALTNSSIKDSAKSRWAG